MRSGPRNPPVVEYSRELYDLGQAKARAASDLATLERLLRCPECGGVNLSAFHHEDMAWWQWTCIDCGADGPWRNTQIYGLLAWHKVTP